MIFNSRWRIEPFSTHKMLIFIKIGFLSILTPLWCIYTRWQQSVLHFPGWISYHRIRRLNYSCTHSLQLYTIIPRSGQLKAMLRHMANCSDMCIICILLTFTTDTIYLSSALWTVQLFVFLQTMADCVHFKDMAVWRSLVKILHNG